MAMSGSDVHDLERFVQAQAGSYEQALAELHRGRKTSHWMWYIFPQFAGLGSSSTSKQYAVRNMDEARAYLRHPVLGPRLVACCDALLAHEDKSARDILGSPDDLKLRSCMTLFMEIEPPLPVFAQVLARFFQGEPDARTLELMRVAAVATAARR